LEAGLNASLELQRRETMGIRTKHFGASGLEGLKAMEIGENNVTKKVPVLVLKTYEKADAQKWASPVCAQTPPTGGGAIEVGQQSIECLSFPYI